MMEFQNYIYVQIVFLFGILLFLGREILLAKKKSDSAERKQLYILQLILLVGVLVRLVNLSYPFGVYVDEAMGAYDSWSLANFGVDSNLASYPVYLKSWGTGQSVLYAYLALPFIKVFGLSAAVYRLPMSLVGCFSLLFFYFTLRKTQSNTLLVFCVTAFLAIAPWHIIKCRFGLDCNIFPDLLLIGICFIVLAYTRLASRTRDLLYVLGFSVLAISAYGYGVSWFMLPFLYLILVVYLLKTKSISKKATSFSILISFILILPLLLFAISLLTGGDQYQIGSITITKLETGRHNETTLMGASDKFATLLSYLGDSFRLFFWGIDNATINSFYPYGVFYNLISLPILGIGMYYAYKEKSFFSIIFFFVLISSIPILLLVEPSIWRWNVLWFPLIYFIGYGIFKLCTTKLHRRVIFSIYILLFLNFIYIYSNNKGFVPFYSDNYGEELKFAQTLDIDKVYYPGNMTQAEALFYHPIDPAIFAKTRQDEGWPIKVTRSYDNVVIGLPDSIEPYPRTAYVVLTEDLKYIDPSKFKIRKGKYYYSVIWND